MTFAEKLFTLRKAHGYTQEDVAEKLGVSRQAVARWEAGETTPELKLLHGLCKLFDVSADYLIHDDWTEPQPPAAPQTPAPTPPPKPKQYPYFHLVSAIGFGIASVCAIVAAPWAVDVTQVILSYFASAMLGALCGAQIYLYNSKK